MVLLVVKHSYRECLMYGVGLMKKKVIALVGIVLVVVVAVSWVHFLGAASDELPGMAIIEDSNGDRIAVEPTSGGVWDELVELYHSEGEMWIGGVVQVFIFIRPDPNYPWGFRFKPENITVAEVTAEGLQTTIRGICEDVDYWISIGQAYVFAKVAEIREREETGDITGSDGYPDGQCDMRDVGLVARNFGETVPPAPSNCDITGLIVGMPDGAIDMRDVSAVAIRFGEVSM
jgi:hypothetical protein